MVPSLNLGPAAGSLSGLGSGLGPRAPGPGSSKRGSGPAARAAPGGAGTGVAASRGRPRRPARARSVLASSQVLDDSSRPGSRRGTIASRPNCAGVRATVGADQRNRARRRRASRPSHADGRRGPVGRRALRGRSRLGPGRRPRSSSVQSTCVPSSRAPAPGPGHARAGSARPVRQVGASFTRQAWPAPAVPTGTCHPAAGRFPTNRTTPKRRPSNGARSAAGGHPERGTRTRPRWRP